MKVRLLKDVRQGGGLKRSPERAATTAEQIRPDGQRVRVPMRVGAPAVEWEAGAVVDMSEASAADYIERGLAEAVEE